MYYTVYFAVKSEKNVILDVNDTTEFLNSVQEYIAMLDARLVLVVLGIWTVLCLDNAVHLVYATVQASGSNETSQLLIDKADGNTKSIGHIL